MANTFEIPGKLLGQARPANTTAVAGYTLPANTTTEITRIQVANTTGSAATYQLFHDDDGSTYDETTALVWNVSIGTGATSVIGEDGSAGIWLSTATGTIGVQTGTGNALTFSIYGREDTS